MPGPKMGPRPADFDEAVIRQSPTFIKWLSLEVGEKMRYACREFVKGNGQDEERLMRRIMIARRNNLRDHEVLKQARKHSHKGLPTAAAVASAADEGIVAAPTYSTPTESEANQHVAPILPPESTVPPFDDGLNASAMTSNELSQSVSVPLNTSSTAGAEASAAPVTAVALSSKSGGGARVTRREMTHVNDQQVLREMDVSAVEATRSYRAWKDLPEGGELVYNQKYVKGQPGHDWLLKKNIWRRMRYRRDCKRMVEALRTGGDGGPEAASVVTGPAGDSTVAQQLGASVPLQSLPARGAIVASKRKTRSQASKRQRKDGASAHQPESHQSHLAMDSSMDDPHGSLNDTHESTSLDQLLDESTNKIVQSVKVGLLDAASIMAAPDATHGVGAQLLMSTDAGTIRLNHHHPMDGVSDEDAVDQEALEAAVAAAESFGKTAHILAESMASMHHHHHGHHDVASVVVGQDHHHDQQLDTAALDAAAKLAAAAALGQDVDDADAVAAAAAAAVAASAKDLYETEVGMV